MISITGKKWVQKKINKNSIEKLKQDYNFSETLCKLIISRDFDDNEVYSIENNLQTYSQTMMIIKNQLILL